jgi:hypothetical protein
MVPSNDLPNIKHKNDVTLFEAYDIETGAFRPSMSTYFDSTNNAWIGGNHQA